MKKEITELLKKNGWVPSHTNGNWNRAENMWFLKQGQMISVHIEDFPDDDMVEDLFNKEEISKANK